MFTFHVLSISEREAIQKNSQLRKTEVQKYFKICEIYKNLHSGKNIDTCGQWVYAFMMFVWIHAVSDYKKRWSEVSAGVS